jgi:hypothetical protein
LRGQSRHVAVVQFDGAVALVAPVSHLSPTAFHPDAVDRVIRKEIDQVTYLETLTQLLARKLNGVHPPSAEGEHYKAKAKIMAWAYRKGYEGDLVARVLDELWSVR